jgi:Acyl-CoA dehydrogenase, middle domain/Acyl-CoA dehydrogenase, N-terminal domain
VVDFTLTDEQKALREMAHDFAAKEIRPVAWEYDKDGTWPDDVLRKAWALGLMNTHTPEEYGGPGVSYLEGALIEEELAWGCSGIATSIGANGLASAPLALAGSAELKKQYLGMLTEDFKLASFCLTEPDAGSDVSGMRTTAVRKGDKYVINGSKCFITNGGYADWFTVYAKTDREAGHRGISCFIVPKDATVTVDKKEDKMGQRASNTATITFNETEIPADHLIGEENKGFKIAMMTLDRTRPGVRVRDQLLQGARPVRRADRDAPGDPVHDRRHGDEGAPVAPGDVELRRAARPGAAQHRRVLARQALRRRRRDGGSHRRRAGLRRLRLHQGVPRREVDARREDHAALRGHVADPAARDRARDAAAAADRGASRRLTP